MKEQKYAFVCDIRGVILSPMKEEKAWYKVRKGKAKVLDLDPLRIQLLYEVDNTDNSKLCVGLDVGQTTGIALLQQGQTGNKVVFKGEIQHRKDVSKLLTKRSGYRRLRRSEKRYRPARFNNRASSRALGRLAPSIRTRQDEILRVFKYIQKRSMVYSITVEDVAFDIRALTNGYTPYKWEYQKSNRLDENLRKATLMRDSFTCQYCGSRDCVLEVHHITPRRENGEDTLGNLITLCTACHTMVTGHEGAYKGLFYNLTKGKYIGLRYASHVMQGKNYLYAQLSLLCSNVYKTDGGTTANRRIDWCISKSHSNDAIVITGLQPICVDTYEYVLKPVRKKRNCSINTSLSIVQGDVVYYTPRNSGKIKCYVNAILQSGIHVGKYKLKSVKNSDKRFGPVSLHSLTKVEVSQRSLKIS